MADYYQTLNFAFQTPQPSEDLDIPGDMKLLADQVDTALAQQINNNVINGVTLTTDGPTNTASIVNGILLLNIVPEVDVSAKYDKAGGAISGNVSITGTLAVTNAATFAQPVTVAAPTLASHATTKQYVDSALAGSTPIGTVVMFASATAPAGWLLCNGAAIPSQYTALKAIVGNNTPDLRNKFIVGAGGTYGVRTTAGAANSSITLTTTQLPSHNHTINPTTHTHNHPNSYANGVTLSHYHWSNTNYTNTDHAHAMPQTLVLTSFNGTNQDDTVNSTNIIAYRSYTWTADTTGTANTLTGQSHAHSFTTNDSTVTHNHSLDIQVDSQAHSHTSVNTGSGSAFSIMPESYALTYIIFAGA
jgi:microcystin-dependent protein